MIQLIEGLPDAVVGLEAVGQVESADYEAIAAPAVKHALERHPRIRLIHVLDDRFTGYTAGGAWQDAMLGLAHPRSFERIAVVTDSESIRRLVRLADWSIPGELQLFPNRDRRTRKRGRAKGSTRRDRRVATTRLVRASAAIRHRTARRSAMSSTKSDTSGAEVADVVEARNEPAEGSGRARVVPHLSVAERVARGQAARAEVPRSSHAEFAPAAHRADPVDLLESQAESRVPELVPIRYGRMLVSPFTFYRGAALLMAADLAASPHSGLRVQLCGDAHLSNFGVFASPDRRLVFDLNDFDETLPGPWEWDVKRLAVSFEVAGRENGYPRKERRRIVRETVAAYRQAMRSSPACAHWTCGMPGIEVDELMAQLRGQVKKGMTKRADETVAKARTSDSMTAFSKLTRVVDGEPQIVV